MKKMFAAFILSFSFINTVNATPNVWKNNFYQGWQTYSITNKDGSSLNLYCNVSNVEKEGMKADHHVTFSYTQDGPHFDENQVSFLIDGNEEGPAANYGTMTTHGANAWYSFINALSKGKVIDVYVANKKLATFQPTKQSIQKVATNLEKYCPPL